MKIKHIFTGFLLMLYLMFVASCNMQTGSNNLGDIEEFRSMFSNPPSEYRSAPLWFWNEQVSKEGIDFQMKEFKKVGMGGVFVHPRAGLFTEYLSKDWLELFDYTVQKGKELDMKVWIYDEYSYPSGFAGGHVAAQMPDSYKHGTGLKMEIQNSLNIVKSDTIEVVLKKEGNKFINITGSIDSEIGKKGEYYVFEKTYPTKSYWNGGFPYVDLLYNGVTDKFLEITMTKGYEKNKADFGKTLPGVFSDEPNLEAAMSKGTDFRWTPDLWDEFQKRWGYDLKVNLPSLIQKTGDWKKVRHDYYELILELFIDRWAKPYSEYCDENSLSWTGHYWEHGWPRPTHGFDEAAFYIWFQQPGVDMLGSNLKENGHGGNFGNDRAIRELRSAANQAGRTRTLSETYGGGGWNISFKQQKKLVDWQCVLGVNFVNQHGSYYSMNGDRKYDYPPSFSYHEPWWKHYKLMGDYIGRISLATSVGQQINKILVLQPTTSAWMYFSRKKEEKRLGQIQAGFKAFVYELEQEHIEYDLGSENVIKTLGSVKDNLLHVGERAYSLVVIPAEMDNIDESTLKLLKEYLANGGEVISFNPSIAIVDGAESNAVMELAKQFSKQWVFANNISEAKVREKLKNSEFELEDITKKGTLYHQRREFDNGQLIFLANTHDSLKAKTKITLKGKHLVKMDLVSGEQHAYPSEKRDGKLHFEVELQPVGSALFAVVDKKPSNLKEIFFAKSFETLNVDGDLKVERKNDNILIINYLDIKTSKTDKKDVYFKNVGDNLFKEYGIEMGNPWNEKIQYKKNFLNLDANLKNSKGFTVDYHFEINSNLSESAMKSICAVVERPELWQISINGNKVSKKDGAYWIDKGFPKYELGKFLKKGKNTITLQAPRMSIFAEIMPIYIIGDFAVHPGKKGFEIAGGDIGKLGSWKDLGLPFYSQDVSYTQKFNVEKSASNNYKVKLGKWNGSVSNVIVNGKQAGNIAWQPNELMITELLKDGENKVEVVVTGTLKNTFGNFYIDRPGWIIGPYMWNIDVPENIASASDYLFDDYGLFEPFKLIKEER
jgi:hypothetical protein